MTDDIQILIVEDEAIIAENLRVVLNSFGYSCFEPIHHFDEAVAFLTHTRPDLVMLDINLGSGDKDGIALGKLLHQNHHVPVVFVTANTDKETVNRAMQAHPSAYVPKPFNKQILFTAVQVALANFNLRKIAEEVPRYDQAAAEMVFVKVGSKYLWINWDEVKYIEADGKYSMLVTAESRYPIRVSLEELSNQLRGRRFVRIHRSHIVNLLHVAEFDGNTLSGSGFQLSVSSGFKEQLLGQMQLLS